MKQIEANSHIKEDNLTPMLTRAEIEAERADLIRRRDETQVRLDSIKSQVNEAKRRARATGEYSDSEWFCRAESAMRHRGRELLQIAGRLSDLKREEKALNVVESQKSQELFGRLFIEAAKRRLHPTVFAELIREANGQQDTMV